MYQILVCLCLYSFLVILYRCYITVVGLGEVLSLSWGGSGPDRVWSNEWEVGSGLALMVAGNSDSVMLPWCFVSY